MDYVTRQFINLAKKLRSDLRKNFSVLHRDLEKIGTAISNQQESDRQEREANEEQRKRAAVPIPQAEQHPITRRA